ncbi:hypothetical protein JNO54_02100 [Janibacter sp. YIM B02568]|uniref:hypothetical protein n=1 Tax=Janibacter endophyticus TaxID=2806261 RepID=UPI00194ED730|nr:hypothetical protein [Janibacter endophyticus]MBM6544934.1 hypothetical protein [Janibacter endophyticus]
MSEQRDAAVVSSEVEAVVTVEFCGETFPVSPGEPLVIGREGDVEVDDNPYLHRSFLQVEHDAGLWWLRNVGSTLTATVADPSGAFQAWLAPGARIPLAFERLTAWFTAGPTTYELDIVVSSPAFQRVESEVTEPADDVHGETTVGRVSLTPDQKLLLVALCEDFLRRPSAGTGTVPTSAQAAERLGWALTRFNRKLDNVSQKFADAGVRGLHGGPGRLASNRKSRLAEHALATRVVQTRDLGLLPVTD